MKKTYYIIQRADCQYRKIEYDKETMTIILGWTYNKDEAKRFDRFQDAVMAKRSSGEKRACTIISETIEI